MYNISMNDTFAAYISIVFSLTLILAAIVINSIRKSYTIDFDIVSMLFLILMWPSTLCVMGLLYLWELFQRLQAYKVKRILAKYESGSIENCIHLLAIKELKQIKFSTKVGATYVSPRLKELVEHYLIEKHFEETFLGKHNEKKKKNSSSR